LAGGGVAPVNSLAQNIRSIEEMKLMTERELLTSGVQSCESLGIYWGTPSYQTAKSAVLRHVERIGLVMRERNQGRFPYWVPLLQAAVSDWNVEACHNLLATFDEKKGKP
jgi:hypothetical protein